MGRRSSILPLFGALIATLVAIAWAGVGAGPAHATDVTTGLRIVKVADAGQILSGAEASYHVYVWNPGPETIFDVHVEEVFPEGLTWAVEHVSDHEPASCESSATPGGSLGFSCAYPELAPSSMEEGIVWRVHAQTDRTDCGVLHNEATASASGGEAVTATADITVECGTLTIDKTADAETIVIAGPSEDLAATPSVVTWTLAYTLAGGPVTNAVITDEVPAGFEFLDASGDGQLVDGAVTWTFPTLGESGSVTFRTTVDPETISRVGPTVNVAVIASAETAPDEGMDSVAVEVVPPPLAGNPTPAPVPGPAIPDTAAGMDGGAAPTTVSLELLGAVFLSPLGAMALASARARSRRR